MGNPLYELWHEVYKDAKLVHGYHYTWPVHDTVETHGNRYISMFETMKQAQHEFSWAVPDQTAIELLVKHSPIVEIGAGRGYWASLVQAAGGDVVCYDENPPDRSTENIWCPPDGTKTVFQTIARVDTPVFTEVLDGGPEKVIDHQDRTLFLCWPPMSTMAQEAVEKYTGNTVIYIGEGEGGCTAGDFFFDHLKEHFDETAHHPIPFWEGLHDALTIFTRKDSR